MNLNYTYYTYKGEIVNTIIIDNVMYVVKIDDEDVFEVNDDKWDNIAAYLKTKNPNVVSIEGLTMSAWMNKSQ